MTSPAYVSHAGKLVVCGWYCRVVLTPWSVIEILDWEWREWHNMIKVLDYYTQ